MKEFVKMTLVGVGKTGYQVLSEMLLHSPTERVGHAATVLLNRFVSPTLQLISWKIMIENCLVLENPYRATLIEPH